MKLQPCKECIPYFRNRLFELKTTTCGMRSYDSIKKYILNNLYDMYTNINVHDIKHNIDNFNIEHVIPSTIISSRPTDESKITVNKEPFHDPHILFPTLKEINVIRSNYGFGNIATNRKEAVAKDVTRFINRNIYLENFGSGIHYEYSPKHVIKVPDITKLPSDEKFDIYIQDKDAQIINDIAKKKSFLVCDLGKCIFQPSKEFSGDISRIIFYYYLMYAYNPNRRPISNTYPWLGRINEQENACEGFDIESWIKFFYEHLTDYYEWAKNDPINDIEILRNKKILALTGVPNIFVGYYNDKGEYVNSNFDFIDELLFGKKHDHNKYQRIKFYRAYKECPQIPLNYDDKLINNFNKQLGKKTCRGWIINNNVNAINIQEKMYDKPTLPITSISQSGGFNNKYNYKYKKYKQKYIKLKDKL